MEKWTTIVQLGSKAIDSKLLKAPTEARINSKVPGQTRKVPSKIINTTRGNFQALSRVNHQMTKIIQQGKYRSIALMLIVSLSQRRQNQSSKRNLKSGSSNRIHLTTWWLTCITRRRWKKSRKTNSTVSPKSSNNRNVTTQQNGWDHSIGLTLWQMIKTLDERSVREIGKVCLFYLRRIAR